MNTLYGKLAAVLLGLFCLVGVSFLMIAYFSMQMFQHEVTQRLNRDLAAHIAAEKILIHGPDINRPVLAELFQQIMVVNPSIEIYLLDAAGRIRAFSAPPGKVKLRSVDLAPLHAYLQASANLPILGQDPRSENTRKIFSAARIPAHGPVDGYLYVILGGERHETVAQLVQAGYIPKLGLAAIAGSLLFALLTGLLLFGLLTRRLSRLTGTVENFRQSHYTGQNTPKQLARQGDEIDRLVIAFQEMTSHIAEQMNKLKITDQLRRELVANVSHDLRTPLAAMQGYIETMILKQNQLSPEEQRRYLEIAMNHSERLGRLVTKLFELAKLDSGEVQISNEPFPIAELIQDVVQEFQLTAEKRGIVIETYMPKKDLLANADIGLIERVLENLIDNALSYTPEGGSVRLTLSLNAGQVRVQVADTGCGIPPEETARIFDRFYRVEKSRQPTAEGAGLGLAIAKRILELHGSPITVESTVNAGSTFSFQLPACLDPSYSQVSAA